MDTSKVREIKQFGLIQRVEINDALRADNQAKKRLNARVLFVYDEQEETGEEDDLQAFLAGGQSGNVYSTIIDLQTMKFPEGTTDRLAAAKEKCEGKRAKFSTFVVPVSEITKGKKTEKNSEAVSLACDVCNDGKREMQSQSVSYVGWKTTKEYASERIELRFWQRVKARKLFLGHLKPKVTAPVEEEVEDDSLGLKQGDDEVIDNIL